MQISHQAPASCLERLRSIPLLGGCSKRELRTVDELTCRLTVSTGRCLAHEGDFAFGLGLIVDGDAWVSRRGVRAFEIGSGSCYGSTTAFGGRTQIATVVATRETMVLVAGAREFQSLIRVPAVAAGLLQWHSTCSRLALDELARAEEVHSSEPVHLTRV